MIAYHSRLKPVPKGEPRLRDKAMRLVRPFHHSTLPAWLIGREKKRFLQELLVGFLPDAQFPSPRRVVLMIAGGA